MDSDGTLTLIKKRLSAKCLCRKPNALHTVRSQVSVSMSDSLELEESSIDKRLKERMPDSRDEKEGSL